VHILLQLLVVIARRPVTVEEGPQDELLYIVPLNLFRWRTEKPPLEVCIWVSDTGVALLDEGATLRAGERGGVVGGALEVGAVWEKDEEVEEGLGDRDGFDNKRNGKPRSPQAVDSDERQGVEDAERGEVVEADDAGADEDVLEAGVVNHLDSDSTTLCA